jgi:hypothetical protein
MAAKINVTEKFTRQDTFRVHPEDVATGLDARFEPAINQDELDRQRAISILEQGQLQPIPVRRDADNRLVTIAGNTRHRAVKLLRAGFTVGEGDAAKTYHDPEATIWVAVQKMTAEEAFDAGVAENQERHNTTDLQEALAQNYYRTVRGLNDTQIAGKYGYTNTNRVAALKKLLAAPDAVKTAVHEKRFTLEAAVKAANLPAEKLQPIVDKLAAGEKLDGSTVRKAGATQDAETPAGPVKVFKRTVKDFKNFAADAQSVTDTTEAKKALLAKIGDWLDGKIGDKALWNAIDKI